jgi:hypothetical protein
LPQWITDNNLRLHYIGLSTKFHTEKMVEKLQGNYTFFRHLHFAKQDMLAGESFEKAKHLEEVWA